MLRYLPGFLISMAVTALVTLPVIKAAPYIGAMDIPKDNRRMHTKPVPRCGGIAIYIGILCSFITLWPLDSQLMGILLAATLMMLIGLADDIRGLSARVKLAGQICCALILWIYTLQIRGMANFFPIGPSYIVFPTWLSLIVTVIWIVGITNTINLIDGLDGLAAGISLISCLSVAYIANYTGRAETCTVMCSVAGACMGFLLWNFNPAKIFMGDSGALLLGLLLSSVSLVGDTPTKSITLFSVTVPIMILALPIFDTAFAIVRRTVNHRPIMEADKGHLHHRIMAMGFGQRRTVLALYSISAIMGVAGILWTVKMKPEALLLFAIASVLVFIFLGIGIDKNDKIFARECEYGCSESSDDTTQGDGSLVS